MALQYSKTPYIPAYTPCTTHIPLMSIIGHAHRKLDDVTAQSLMTSSSQISLMSTSHVCGRRRVNGWRMGAAEDESEMDVGQ